MLKNIQQKQQFIFTLSSFLLLVFGNFSVAFEKFGVLNNQCRSTCHQAGHIKQSRKDKLSKPECKTCHLGANQTSPFSAVQKSIFPVGRGLLLKSLVQTLPSKIKNSTQKSVSTKEMALIPKGEFVMGSNERWDDEAPEHISFTKSFYMDTNEVTNSDYKKFVDSE